MPGMRLSSRSRVVGSVVAVLAVVLIVLWGSGHAPWSERSSDRRTPGGANQPAPTQSNDQVVGPTASGRAPAVVPLGVPKASVQFNFEGTNLASVRDDHNKTALQVESVNGGALTLIAHGAGQAVQYPALCAHYAAAECQRAILTSGNDVDFLNPGTHPIRYGAMVLLAANATSKGENVLQKGYSTTGVSQFKLQIDGQAGQPSCVLVGQRDTLIYAALSGVSVADGKWHQVECVRSGNVLAVQVDGARTGSVSVPINLSVSNDAPLRLGGKGSGPNNDQYNGALDDVYVNIYG